MKLTCTSTLSSHAAKSTVDDFMVALKVPGPRCYSDIVGLTSPIQQQNEYIIDMWAGATTSLFDPGLVHTVEGCPLLCTLGEVPSRTNYNDEIIQFDSMTGQLSIATSSMEYNGITMDLMITCTSTESINIEALRTVTDTFSVRFIGSESLACAQNSGAFVILGGFFTQNYEYMIDGANTPLMVEPMFMQFDPFCPMICTLYEGRSAEPWLLPIASDPVF